MHKLSLVVVILALVFDFPACYGQINTITFAHSSTTTTTTTTTTTPKPTTTTPKPTTTTTKKPTTVPPCRCVLAGTCTTIGFDVRIVNQGNPGCPAGQVWCCGSSNLQMSACGVRKITDSPAQPVGTARFGSYPWQAALLTQRYEYIGSGVLISPKHVLTVAHKIAPYPNRNFLVRLGEWDGQKLNEADKYQEYTPARLITHPSFSLSNLHNDIAIIVLDRDVSIASSPNINTACLGTMVPAAGTRCWVSGWGETAFGAVDTYQSIMKEVDVPIVDQSSCEARMRGTRLGQFFNLDRTSFMCAGGESGKDACTGDGGSPLVCETITGQWQVVGLVAWGIGCADSNVPGVYVNVPNYRPWINQQTGLSF